jgi:putative signal transducing protein
MFCPQCGVEYPWHVMVCPACEADTVDRLPGPDPTPDAKLEAIFATGDPGLIAVAKSLLDAEDIDYFIKGEGLQDLFAFGRMTGFNYVTGPAEFWVRGEDATHARALLRELTSDPPKDAGSDG